VCVNIIVVGLGWRLCLAFCQEWREKAGLAVLTDGVQIVAGLEVGQTAFGTLSISRHGNLATHCSYVRTLVNHQHGEAVLRK
jgi:outer membrane PBP1 activator LpoA protein